MDEYDLVIIGAGPAGEKAASKAAYFGYKVAVIEKSDHIGGAGVFTWTVPVKRVKEFKQSSENHENDEHLKTLFEEFTNFKTAISNRESNAMFANLLQHGVDIFKGKARFVDSYTLEIVESGKKIKGKKILIASGSAPHHPENIPFDDPRVYDGSTFSGVKKIPKTLCILGGGVIGCEYATIFSNLGTKVYLLTHGDILMHFCDHEMVKALTNKMRNNGIEIVFHTNLAENRPINTEDRLLEITLDNGATIQAEMFLYAEGREAQTSELNCDVAGIILGKHGVVAVDDKYQTSQPHIYAVGDVIGFPALASASMEQGRIAISNMFQLSNTDSLSQAIPHGIYTIPEIAMVGMTEEQAIKEGIHYCTGRASYQDVVRGKILDCESEFIKIIFNADNLEVIGVHILGSLASELIHYGMMLVNGRSTVNDILASVHNYPTLHELYKYASYDGLGNLSGHKIRKPSIE